MFNFNANDWLICLTVCMYDCVVVTVALLLFFAESWSSSDFLTCVQLCVNVTVMKQKTVHAMMRNRSMKPVITLLHTYFILHVVNEQFTDSFILLLIVTVLRN